MTTRTRRGLFHSSLVLGILGSLLVVTAIGASAMIPKAGQQSIRNGFIFTDLTGYQSPGTGTACNAYAPNATFTFSATARNRFNARDQKMDFEIYKMTQLSPSTCYTEAQLENMVLTGTKSAEQLVSGGSTAMESFAFDQTHSVGASASETCGYFQFDMGLAGTGPFAPKAGYEGPPVSGFVLFNGPQCATPSSGGVSPSTTTTTSTSAARLAGTGGGPTAPIGAGLILLAGLSLIAAGLSARRRAVR